jgi:sec-independent protein translocase protein TatA
MFGIGMPELIVILVILLVIFGARRLPEIGSGLGQGIRNFRSSMKDAEKELAAKDEQSSRDKEDA